MDKQSTSTRSGEPSIEKPDSRLLRRLTYRATHPAGVIDSKHPEHLHSRTAGWIGNRLGWLGQLRSRYTGEDVNAAMEGPTFASTPGPSRNEASASWDNAATIARKRVEPKGTSPSFATAAPLVTSSAPLLRISRRSVPMPVAQTSKNVEAPGVQRKFDSTAPGRGSTPTPQPSSSNAVPEFMRRGMTGTKNTESVPPISVGPLPLAAQLIQRTPAVVTGTSPQPGRDQSVGVKEGSGMAEEAPHMIWHRAGSDVSADKDISISSLPTSSLEHVTPTPKGIARQVDRSSVMVESAINEPETIHGSRSAEPAQQSSSSDALPELTRRETGGTTGNERTALPRERDHSVGVKERTGITVEAPQMIWRKAGTDVSVEGKHSTGNLLPSSREQIMSAAPVIARQLDRGSSIVESANKERGTNFNSRSPATPKAARPSVEPTELVRKGTSGTRGNEVVPRTSPGPLPLTAPLIRRKAVDVSGAAFPAGRDRSVVMRERPDISGPAPQMIWRNAGSDVAVDGKHSTSDLLPSSQEQIMRGAPIIAPEIDRGSLAVASRTGETQSVSSGSQGDGMNLQHLAEQVSRILARQLEAERARRGLTR